ncbi:LuxR C-terminal-related transcriptional regulator [Streptomyces sp. NPDC046887]|uniref:helix-turn-helix transcriptional regulator n=1 Tax=Streptomyces sp. NPDC046887 TaxID=3155472 RepID=UPI0033C11928
MFVVPSPKADGPVVGREAESERFARLLDGLERGRGAVVEIAGEPGAGKTQLACRLADLAARRGLPVIWARAPRSGEDGPFRVFRAAVGSTGAAEPSDPAAWCELIRRRAAGGVLLVDDLHRADPSSLEVVLRLMHSPSSASPVAAPFVLALAHRPRQSPPALLEALDLGVRTDGIVRVEAGPLDVAAVAALLDHWHRPAGPLAYVTGGGAVEYGPGAPEYGAGAVVHGAGAARPDMGFTPGGAGGAAAYGAGSMAYRAGSMAYGAGAPDPDMGSAPGGAGGKGACPGGTSAYAASATEAPGPDLAPVSGTPGGTAASIAEAAEAAEAAEIAGVARVAGVAGVAEPTRAPEVAAGGTGSSAAALHAASKGLPGYLRLLVAAGFEAGLWPERAGADEDGLLREAAPLLAELGALSEPARAAARAAAVLGGAFRPADAARIAGLGARDGLEACAELVRADLVRPAGHGGRLAFRHPVVGQVAHADCELPFLLDAHRRALRIAAERGAPARERARHAEHLVHTDGATAARVLAEGAAEAVTQAPAYAARWLRLALDALPARDPGVEERAAWELAHCRALIASGRLREARALAHELLAEGGPRLTGQAADGGARLTPRLLLRAYAVCADAERLLCRYEEAEAIARTGMALLPRPLPAVLSAEATELIYEYGLVHVLRGTHDRIRPLLREAARARTEAGPVASAALGVLIAFCDVFSGDIARGAPEVARCAALVDALPDGVAGHTPDVLALLGCAELYLERFPDARRHLRRGLDAATGGAQKHIRAHQLLGLTMIDQWGGRLDAAERRAAEAEELARAVGAPDVVTLATAMRAMTLVWARGRRYAGEAIALAARAVDTAALGRGWWATSAISLLAHAQLVGGDAAGCLRTLLDGGGGEGLPQVQPAFRPSLLALMANAALAAGDTGYAERLLADAEADAGRLGLPLQWACVHRASAQLRMAHGERAKALELFERAAEGFRGGGLPVQHAWTLIASIPVTAAVRGPAAALDVLTRAEALARPCGAALVLEEAERIRARLAPGARPVRGGGQSAGPRAGASGAAASRTGGLRPDGRRAAGPQAEGRRAADVRSADSRAAGIRSADSRAGDRRAADSRTEDRRAAGPRAEDRRAAGSPTADIRARDPRAGASRAAAAPRPADSRAGASRTGNSRAGASQSTAPRPADSRTGDFPPPPVLRSAELRSALSEREREVADLAAAGLRSRQIAERLFLSHRTVDSHLGSVYRKLGVSSRTALARALGPAADE